MYWKEHRKTARNFSAGREGWQVKVVGTKIVEQPFSSRKYPEAAKDLKQQVVIDTLIAKAARDKEDYDGMWRRISRDDFNYIIDQGLKGESLRNWCYNTPTSEEYAHALRYG